MLDFFKKKYEQYLFKVGAFHIRTLVETINLYIYLSNRFFLPAKGRSNFKKSLHDPLKKSTTRLPLH